MSSSKFLWKNHRAKTIISSILLNSFQWLWQLVSLFYTAWQLFCQFITSASRLHLPFLLKRKKIKLSGKKANTRIAIDKYSQYLFWTSSIWSVRSTPSVHYVDSIQLTWHFIWRTGAQSQTIHQKWNCRLAVAFYFFLFVVFNLSFPS